MGSFEQDLLVRAQRQVKKSRHLLFWCVVAILSNLVLLAWEYHVKTGLISLVRCR